MAENNSAIFHVGQVSSNQMEAGASRAAFDDLGGMVSAPFQILFPPMGKFRMWCTPREGDHVAVMRSPNGLQEGYILGTMYTADNLPKGAADGVLLIASEDGQSYIRLDAINGTIQCAFREDWELHGKTLTAYINGPAAVKCKSLAAEVEGAATIECNTLEATASGAATVKAPAITLEGDTTIKGNVTIEGDISHDGNMSTSGVHTDSNGVHQ